MKILIAITLVIALVALGLGIYNFIAFQEFSKLAQENISKGFEQMAQQIEQQMKDAEASMMMQLQMMMPESQEFLQ